MHDAGPELQIRWVRRKQRHSEKEDFSCKNVDAVRSPYQHFKRAQKLCSLLSRLR